jgi:alkylhydroperoxidase/carboxymuconolactone decarboxylase family protein YurZ
MQNSMYYTTSGLTSLPAYQGGGYLDQYGRQRYGLGKFVSKITKPIAKVLDKVVPNEIKPALPFIAAAAPFMLNPGFSFLNISQNPLINQALSRAIVGAGANAFSQLSQEGAAERGLNPLSLGLSAATAGLTTPGIGEVFRGGQVLGVDELGQALTRSQAMPYLQSNYPGLDFSTTNLTGMGSQFGLPLTEAPTSFLDSAKNLITETVAKGADVLGEGVKALSPGGEGVFSKQFLTAAVPGQLAAAGEMAYNAALDAKKKYEDELLAMNNLASANKQDQINYIRRAMQSAGFTEDEIASAITRSGFASGGITRTKFGGGGPGMGSPKAYESFKDFLEQINISYPELDIIDMYDNNPSDAIKILEGMGLISEGKKDMKTKYAAEGGLMNLKMGGMPVEMDLRAKGGFVPIGKKERADDVPARLSKNEFVFTAKAVRNAGGGDVRKGAKRMYQIMNQLEARA